MANRPKLKKDPFHKETSSFRMSKRNARQARQRLFTNLFIVATMAVLFVGGYFYLNHRNKLKLDSDPKQERIELGSFEDILNNGNATQLINEYNRIESAPQLNLPVVVDDYEKRLRLANRLLDLKDDKQAVTFGTIAKLHVLSQWDWLNVTEEFGDTNIRNQLNELANSNVDSENPDVRNRALLSLAMMNLYDYATSPADHDFQEAKKKIAELAVVAADDLVSASVLYRGAELLDVKNLKQESSAVFEVLSEAFAESEIEAIRTMAVNARKNYVAVSYDLNNIPDEIDVDREGTLVVIRDRITQIIDKGNMQAEEAETVLRLIELLIGRNEIEEALLHLPKISDQVAALERDPNDMQGKYQTMLAEANAYGKPFDFSGMQDINNEAVDVALWDKVVRLVIFWTPENPVSVDRLTALNRQTTYFQRRSIEPIGIYLDEGSAPANLEFNKLAMEMPQFKLFRVHVNDDQGKQFMSRFPLTRLPFLVLLDENNVIRSIDPPVFRVKTELEKLASEAEKKQKSK